MRCITPAVSWNPEPPLKALKPLKKARGFILSLKKVVGTEVRVWLSAMELDVSHPEDPKN